MNATENKRVAVEVSLLPALCLVLVSSAIILWQKNAIGNDPLVSKEWMTPENEHSPDAMTFKALEDSINTAENPVQSLDLQQGLFSSELRVVAIGSAYPIPYEAEICPFSNISQPAMNQLTPRTACPKIAIVRITKSAQRQAWR